jgi:hypothetical protein
MKFITRRDPLTGKFNSMYLSVTDEQYSAWADGMLIQEAMPDLNADEREFIISGLLPDSWSEIFSEGQTEDE